MLIPTSLLVHLGELVPQFSKEEPRDRWSFAVMLWACAEGGRPHKLWPGMFSFSMEYIRGMWGVSARRRLDAPPGDRRTAMSAAETHKIAAEVMTIRRSHPHAPALDVLDLVMKGRRQLPEFGDIALPPAPFALVVAEAFDGGMTVDEWRRWTVPPADPVLGAAILSIWRNEVWPQFVERYGVG